MNEDPRAGRIAVVGDEGGGVSELVRSVGSRVITGSYEEIDEKAEAVVALGETAVLDLARSGCSTPVLPVSVGGGLSGVPANSLQSAIQRVREGAFDVNPYPALGISVDGDRVDRALTDVMIVTSEPAHISEFGLATPTDSIGTFRADGVVVATPAGSSGYAHRVGGPVLDTDAEALSVIPVGMFSTEADHWTVSLPDRGEALSMSVERDSAPVSILVDDRTVGRLGYEECLSVERDGQFPVITLPESRSPFDTGVETNQTGGEEATADSDPFGD